MSPLDRQGVEKAVEVAPAPPAGSSELAGPFLRDPSKRYRIGPPEDFSTQEWFVAGATSIIYQQGKAVGVYVDNETPNRDVIARQLRQKVNLVVVGLYPKEAGHCIDGCITALEWYPFPFYPKERVPRHDAYITQWLYAFGGCKPPTRFQRWKLYLRVKLRRPKLLWVY